MVSNILLFLTKKRGKLLYVKYRRLYVLVLVDREWSCILDHCFLHKSSLMSSMREKLQRRDALIATRCSLLPLITSYSSQCVLTGCQWHNWLPLQLCSVSCTNSFVWYMKLFKLLRNPSTNDIWALIWNFPLRQNQPMAIANSDFISKNRHYIIASQWAVSLGGIPRQ